jgi:hypothetical protein
MGGEIGMVSLRFVLLLLALISFVLAAFGVPTRINLIGLGLALWVLALLVAPV